MTTYNNIYGLTPPPPPVQLPHCSTVPTFVDSPPNSPDAGDEQQYDYQNAAAGMCGGRRIIATTRRRSNKIHHCLTSVTPPTDYHHSVQ
jgi:hypothetical protein